jgi:transposase-like protein
MTQRDPQRFQFWQTLIADWQQSGQSISAFCRRRGVCESGFYRWQRIFADGRRTLTPPKSVFVPVRVIADTMAEVVLPSGLVVRLPLESEPHAVTQLVAAVRAVAC